MSTLFQLFADDAAAVFADAAGGVAEPVTYTPYNGSPLTDNAPVFRDAPLAVPGANGKFAPQVIVFIRMGFGAAGSASGVQTINKDGDRVTVSDRQNGTAVARQIAEIQSQDPGGWTLRLR